MKTFVLKLSVVFTLLTPIFSEASAVRAADGVDTDAAADSLRRFVGNIGAFNRLFPQEKVYLHFDNTAYFRGETLWFSAYVVRTDKQRLTDMSRVLYAVLSK